MSDQVNFALIGAAGYIAPRHVEAIKFVNGNLVAATDPHDNVGYLDKHFPKCKYFQHIERFDRELFKLSSEEKMVDYVSICSPNYLHDSHIRLAIRNNANCICEKPLVIKRSHLNMLKELEQANEVRIYNILQLRLHPVIIELKNKFSTATNSSKVKLKYITPRGSWYKYSWKGSFDKSGGVMFNIGIHFFDMLIYIFGEVIDSRLDFFSETKAKGSLHLERAEVEFFLSVDQYDLPHKEWMPFRSIQVDGEEVEFSSGFTNLHDRSYEQILNGNGFGIEEVSPAVELVDHLTYNQ